MDEYMVAKWRMGNDVKRLVEVTQRRARLVLGWVTVSFREYTV